MCPLELTATPDTSPKYMLCGRCTGLGTESNAMVGTDCCASAGGAASSNNPSRARFIKILLEGCLFLLVGADASLAPVGSSIVSRALPSGIRRMANDKNRFYPPDLSCNGGPMLLKSRL